MSHKLDSAIAVVGIDISLKVVLQRRETRVPVGGGRKIVTPEGRRPIRNASPELRRRSICRGPGVPPNLH